MSKSLTEKTKASIDKLTIDEQIAFFNEIKGHVSANLAEAQREAEDKANELQLTLNRLNGE